MGGWGRGERESGRVNLINLYYWQEKERSFMTFHDHKPLEPLVREKWGDFNIKVNTTIPELLVWVGIIRTQGERGKREGREGSGRQELQTSL